MPDQTPSHLPDGIDDYKRWKPEYQHRALNMLQDAESSAWRPFYCPDTTCNGQPHIGCLTECSNPYGHQWNERRTDWACMDCDATGLPIDDWTFPHARTDQRPPRWLDDWLTLLLRGGRGSGKTRTGAEITNRVSEMTGRIILIAATGPDLRDTMVEGVSGILATAPPTKRPTWEPSKRRLTWPNGCIAQGFSAEEPDRLRGPQSGFVWADEPAHWDLVDQVWENMLFGLRLKGKKGTSPKVVATSTPKPTKWMKRLASADDTVDRVVATYANLNNLAPTFRKTVLDKFEGTRQGRQELHGEILEDVEGALWNWDIIHWAPEAPRLQRIVVSIDPAGTANKRSDETGIVALGIGADRNIYVLGDETGKYSPDQWAKRAFDLAETFSADAIVFEKNYGGDMVKRVLEAEAKERVGHAPRFIPVTSRRGKDLRAEPIVALYEKTKVFHVGARGDLQKLEEEMTTWVPHSKDPSPNRVDALVHGATELGKGVMPAAIASPADLRRSLTHPRHLRAV